MIVNDVDVTTCDRLLIKVNPKKLHCLNDHCKYKNCKDNPNCRFKSEKRLQNKIDTLEDKLLKISSVVNKFYYENSEVVPLKMLCEEISEVIND